MVQYQLKSQRRFQKNFKKKGIDHEVLNAKNHLKEAEIVANAGKPGQVTIATNMAGRGTDIKLGGLEEDSTYEKNKKISLMQEDYLSLEQNDMNLEESIINLEVDQEDRVIQDPLSFFCH